jgi:hypothetical protein
MTACSQSVLKAQAKSKLRYAHDSDLARRSHFPSALYSICGLHGGRRHTRVPAIIDSVLSMGLSPCGLARSDDQL